MLSDVTRLSVSHSYRPKICVNMANCILHQQNRTFLFHLAIIRVDRNRNVSSSILLRIEQVQLLLSELDDSVAH